MTRYFGVSKRDRPLSADWSEADFSGVADMRAAGRPAARAGRSDEQSVAQTRSRLGMVPPLRLGRGWLDCDRRGDRAGESRSTS